MSEIIWNIEIRKIEDLKDYHKNPRKITQDRFQQLKLSVEKFGLVDKPFINADNTIIGGHQRVRILQRMGYKEIHVQVPSRMLTEAEVEELNYRHNENGGSWDYDILANQYNMTDLLQWGDCPLEKEEKQSEQKKAKPKVIFEFESESVMEEQALLIEEAALTWNAKMKIKK